MSDLPFLQLAHLRVFQSYFIYLPPWHIYSGQKKSQQAKRKKTQKVSVIGSACFISTDFCSPCNVLISFLKALLDSWMSHHWHNWQTFISAKKTKHTKKKKYHAKGVSHWICSLHQRWLLLAPHRSHEARSSDHPDVTSIKILWQWFDKASHF